MKPPEFDYCTPGEVSEVISLLSHYGDEAKILAGGQSLIPLLSFRLITTRHLIDVNRIKELSYIKEEEDGTLRIGALTRHRAIETSELLRAKCPILAYAARFIAHPAIRNRGTFGGSLAHADPAAEFPLIVRALSGKIKAVGPGGGRVFQSDEFFLTYLTTALEPTEMITEISVPPLTANTGWGFQEFAFQHGSFAMVAVAALVQLDSNKICKSASIALAGVGPGPVKAYGAEELLVGEKVTEKLIEAVAKKAAEETEPSSDVHASAGYRREMAKVFTKRALRDALQVTGGIS